MEKAIRLIINIQWVLLASMLLFACRTINVTKKIAPPTTKIDSFDPICGDSVIWHLHLQEGFSSDTVQIIVNKDTFPDYTFPNSWVVATSGNNGCTGIYFTCYKYEGEVKIFLDNMPHFTMNQQTNGIDQNNVNLKVIINGDVIDFEASLAYNRFFGLNYDSKSRSLAVLKGKSCFECR